MGNGVAEEVRVSVYRNVRCREFGKVLRDDGPGALSHVGDRPVSKRSIALICFQCAMGHDDEFASCSMAHPMKGYDPAAYQQLYAQQQARRLRA